MSYHLFYGIDDHDEYTNGMEGYHGIHATMEAAYKAIEMHPGNVWAHLATVNPSDGRLIQVAYLDTQINYPDENHRVISYGWYIEVSHSYLEMARYYQKQAFVEPPQALIIKTIAGTGGYFDGNRWIESDPF